MQKTSSLIAAGCAIPFTLPQLAAAAKMSMPAAFAAVIASRKIRWDSVNPAEMVMMSTLLHIAHLIA